MKDLTEKLAYAFWISGAIMIFILGVVVIQNILSDEKSTAISGFYYVLIFLMFGAGFYLKKLSKNYHK